MHSRLRFVFDKLSKQNARIFPRPTHKSRTKIIQLFFSSLGCPNERRTRRKEEVVGYLCFTYKFFIYISSISNFILILSCSSHFSSCSRSCLYGAVDLFYVRPHIQSSTRYLSTPFHATITHNFTFAAEVQLALISLKHWDGGIIDIHNNRRLHAMDIGQWLRSHFHFCAHSNYSIWVMTRNALENRWGVKMKKVNSRNLFFSIEIWMHCIFSLSNSLISQHKNQQQRRIGFHFKNDFISIQLPSDVEMVRKIWEILDVVYFSCLNEV